MADQIPGCRTWSRYPIVETHAQNWCVHVFVTPSGYQTSLLDVDGRAVVVVNLHAMPQFDFGPNPEDIRTYQLTEACMLNSGLDSISI